MTKTINKPNSATFAKITKDGSGKFIASVMQGQGSEQTFFGAKSFKTENGAERWVAKQFA